MADQNEIYDMLGVEPGRTVILGVQVGTWGAELIVNCSYDDQPFQLHFDECQSIQWDVHGEPTDQDREVDLIGLFLGEEDHQEAGIIYTDLFEIAVRYGTFTLVKDW
jgi:hypothetical protein